MPSLIPASIREFTDLLNPSSRRLLIGLVLNSMGGGMTMSLLLVYLHDLRGFTNTFGGLVLSVGAAVSLMASGPYGALVDRIGPKKVLAAGLLLESAGAFSWSLVTTHWQAMATTVLVSLGASAVWSPQMVALTRLTPKEHRQKIFGLNFMLLNLGLGLGSLIAASIISEGSLQSFKILYYVDSFTFFAYFAIVISINSALIGKYVPEDKEEAKGSYRDLLSNRPIILLAVSGLVLMTFGYGVLASGIPLYSTQYLGLSPKWLGVIFGANTFSIVIFQPYVLRKLSKRSKYSAIISVGAFWAASWAVVGLSALLPMFLAGLAICISQIIFAFGEMIWSPSAPTLINELSPENIRGRANALVGLQWSVSGVLGPAITGLMFGAGLEQWWVLVMFLGALLPIPLLIRLRKMVPGH